METMNNHLLSEICKHLTKTDVGKFRLCSNNINKLIKKDFHSVLLQNVLLKHLDDCVEIIPFLTVHEIITIFENEKCERMLNIIEKIQAKYPKKYGWSLMLKNRYKHLKYLNIDPY